jgi:gas vesicle protein GvpG
VGLITGLLTLPLAPVRGVAWLGEVLAEEANRIQADAESPERRLADIDVMRASGQISDEEASEMEKAVIDAMLYGGRSEP